MVGQVEIERGIVTRMVLGQWSDGGERYFVCQAEVNRKAAGSLGALEQACRAMTVASSGSGARD